MATNISPVRRLKQLEDTLRGSLADWNLKLTGMLHELQGYEEAKPVALPLKRYKDTLERIVAELGECVNNFQRVKEDLNAASAEASYGSILVTTWPANHYLDRMSYIGTGLIGAGGAAFLVGSGIRDFPEWWAPGILLWSVGLALLFYALRGLADWERQKFAFYAWKLAVPEEYRPRIFAKKRRPLIACRP